MSRSSRCADEHFMDIMKDGVPCRLDKACKGDIHMFTVETNLIEPLYFWSLDGIHPGKPLLSTNSYYEYTFDDQDHRLFCEIRSSESNCGITKYVRVEGRVCTSCGVACKTETVHIPAGMFQGLVDDTGKEYKPYQVGYFSCADNTKSNSLTTGIITQTILDKLNCEVHTLEVKYKHNFSYPGCITLTINNSPVKFKYIMINGVYYSFSTRNC